MAVNVPYLPQNWRSPGVYLSNLPAAGGASTGLMPTMIVGQFQSSGTAVANTAIQVFAQSDVNTLCGGESELAQMFAAYRLNDPAGDVWLCPVPDASAGTAASVAVTLAGTATAAGTLTVYVNNVPIQTGISLGDTANAVASNFANAVSTAVANPNFGLGVTGSVVGAVTTLTSVHKGVSVGDIQVKVSKNGPANGEFVPAGLTATVGTLSAGTGDPDLTNAIAAIQAVPWSFLVCPYTTSAVNAQIVTLLSDSVGRWSPINQLYGDRFAAVRGSLTAQAAYGATVGANKHMTTLAVMDSQTPVYAAAAIFAGLAAATVRSAPQLPIVGTLQGLDAPSPAMRLRRVDENTLLYQGLSVIRVDNSGNANLARAVQEYQTDTNYLNIETDYLLEYVDTLIRQDLETTYAQVSLVADGNPAGAGTGAVTPSLILGHVWGLYLGLEAQNIVQNAKQFIAQSYAEANIAAGTVSLFLPVQVAAQLRVIKALVSFSA